MILSVFLLASLALLNVDTYTRERDSVHKNLDVLENRKWMRGDGEDPGKNTLAMRETRRMKPLDMKNVMILDYELYTLEIRDGEIVSVYDSGNTTEDFDVYGIAETILSQDTGDRLYIGNLYFTPYSYRYHANESLVILNNGAIRSKLWQLLAESLILLVGMEIVIILVSGRITDWITKPAEEAFARQKTFVADASHELKTPLAVIMASADEIRGQEEDAKYIENVRYESDRMSRLIAGLLNLSQLESDEGQAAHKEEDLSLILEKSCMAYEAVAYEAGVSIQSKIEEGLILSCNKEEIEQMAATLLDNAVRHSYRDTTVRMIAEHCKEKGKIMVLVINTGDPIPEEDREKIFERFYRSDRARSREDNRYGLGLAIAKRIARNHNGDIEARSEGGDTVFKVILG